MQPGGRFTLWLKILLPVLALWTFNIAPLPHRYTSGLREARQAQRNGQHQLAAARLRQALAAQPARTDLLEQIGLEELAAGRDEEARKALLAAHAAGFISTESRLVLGDLAAKQGDRQAAAAIWNALLVEKGPSGLVYRRLASLYADQRDDQALVEVLTGWYALDPEDPQVAYLLGMQLSVRTPKEALDLLLKAGRADARYSQAAQVMRRGINQAAVAEDAGYGWVMIGRALGSLEEWHLAQRAFEQAVAASPQYAEAWALLSESQYQSGENGRSALEKAHGLNNKSPLVQAITALYWRRQGRLEEAYRYLLEVARQEPGEMMWQIELGHTLVEMGDLEAALRFYQRAVELAPTSQLAWQALARFSIEHDMDIRNLGLPAARQAALIAPDDPAPMNLMGLAFFHLGDTISAERFLQRALEKDAAFAEAYLHLGTLYLQQQDLQKAHEYLRQAFVLAAGKPVGDTARRLLERYFTEGG